MSGYKKVIARAGAGVLLAAAMTFGGSTDAAAATIRIDQFEQGGTLTQAGGNYTGTNIIFEFITFDGNDDGAPENTVLCDSSIVLGVGTATNCLLNFNTAANTFVVTAPTGLYTLAGASITGTTGVILSGTGFFTFGDDGAGNFTSSGTDTKDAELLAYFGVAPGTNFIFNNTEVFVDAAGRVTQADITNTVPEPGSVALLGVALLGLARRMRQRRLVS